ncbi:hypothetical protein RRSWK_00507 [Rhodopirellula sp. SWK7]|nr:hypothetical protein RRSWK_00507 [Rhodopirellula sp. SWK7]
MFGESSFFHNTPLRVDLPKTIEHVPNAAIPKVYSMIHRIILEAESTHQEFRNR